MMRLTMKWAIVLTLLMDTSQLIDARRVRGVKKTQRRLPNEFPEFNCCIAEYGCDGVGKSCYDVNTECDILIDGLTACDNGLDCCDQEGNTIFSDACANLSYQAVTCDVSFSASFVCSLLELCSASSLTHVPPNKQQPTIAPGELQSMACCSCASTSACSCASTSTSAGANP